MKGIIFLLVLAMALPIVIAPCCDDMKCYPEDYCCSKVTPFVDQGVIGCKTAGGSQICHGQTFGVPPGEACLKCNCTTYSCGFVEIQTACKRCLHDDISNPSYSRWERLSDCVLESDCLDSGDYVGDLCCAGDRDENYNKFDPETREKACCEAVDGAVCGERCITKPAEVKCDPSIPPYDGWVCTPNSYTADSMGEDCCYGKVGICDDSCVFNPVEHRCDKSAGWKCETPVENVNFDANRPNNCKYTSCDSLGCVFHDICLGGKCTTSGSEAGWDCYNSALDGHCMINCIDCNKNSICDNKEGAVDGDGDGALSTCDTDDSNPCTINETGDNCGNPGCLNKGVTQFCSTCEVDGDHDGVDDCEDNCPGTYTDCDVDANGCPSDCDLEACDGDPACSCTECGKCGGFFGEVFCEPDDCNFCAGQCYYNDGCNDCSSIGDSCSSYTDQDACDGDTCTISSQCAWNSEDAKCEQDSDGDGYPDSLDNCPLVPNSDQKNSDYEIYKDNLGDVCDFENTDARCTDGIDNDGDGIKDCYDDDCKGLAICGALRECTLTKEWVSEDLVQLCDNGNRINCTDANSCDIRQIETDKLVCNSTHWINIAECELAGRCVNGFYLIIGKGMCNLTEPITTYNCGNYIIEPAEQCDRTTIETTCEELEFDGGTMKCLTNCSNDPSGCTIPGMQTCGDGTIDPGEECDGDAMPIGISCNSLELGSGQIKCDNACKLNKSVCSSVLNPPCNGGINPGEECDGTNLRGLNCKNFGFKTGILNCSKSCSFDTTDCIYGVCGDKEIDPGEECDTFVPNGMTCQRLGSTGTLICNSCKLGGCADLFETCETPNNKADTGEECDGTDLRNLKCKDFGFIAGNLECTSCRFDTKKCVSDRCGNNIKETVEECDGTTNKKCTDFSTTFKRGNTTCVDCRIVTAGCTDKEPEDPDGKPGLCEAIALGEQGICEEIGDEDCYGLFKDLCCGDDGAADTWLDGSNACEGGEYCTEKSCSSLLCTETNDPSSVILCDTKGDKNCWAADQKRCCFTPLLDLEKDTWLEYKSDRSLSDVLVSGTCSRGSWYLREEGNMTLYSLTAEAR